MEKKEVNSKVRGKAEIETSRQSQYDQMIKNRNEDACRRFKQKPYHLIYLEKMKNKGGNT